MRFGALLLLLTAIGCGSHSARSSTESTVAPIEVRDGEAPLTLTASGEPSGKVIPSASDNPVEDEGCPPSLPRDTVDISEPCVDGGDPNEDVDVTRSEDLGKKHTPRPAFDAALYTTTLQAHRNHLGFVRIRSRLVFSANDLRNVIGQLSSCVAVRAAGPMKNNTGSQGLGYAIRVRDPKGRICQGFVSASAVSVL